MDIPRIKKTPHSTYPLRVHRSCFGMALFFAGFSAPCLANSQTPAEETAFKRPPIQEAFERAQAVLDHFKVPREPAPNLSDLPGRQSKPGILKLIPYLEEGNTTEHREYFKLKDSPTQPALLAYQDRSAKRVPDFAVALSNGEPNLELPFQTHLIATRKNPKNRPLLGLKIALDPGHMGGEFWDNLEGKIVRDRQGNKIRESVITLQTVLLLEKELQELGADVFVTKRSLKPVTQAPYPDYAFQEVALNQFASSVQMDWFQTLLSTSPVGPDLFAAFRNSNKVKNIFSKKKNGFKYFNRLDMEARVEAIRAFEPDLTIIVHYDADIGEVHTRPRDGTKAYVSGGFTRDEFSTREQRSEFARILLNPQTWDASRLLGNSIIQQLSKRLSIPIDRQIGVPIKQKHVDPGLFARNLFMNRKLNGFVVSYVETLYYDDPVEFRLLRERGYEMMIDGQRYPYSDRLVQVAQAYRSGILEFVRNY